MVALTQLTLFGSNKVTSIICRERCNLTSPGPQKAALSCLDLYILSRKTHFRFDTFIGSSSTEWFSRRDMTKPESSNANIAY
jgi:hypothetical protein